MPALPQQTRPARDPEPQGWRDRDLQDARERRPATAVAAAVAVVLLVGAGSVAVFGGLPTSIRAPARPGTSAAPVASAAAPDPTGAPTAWLELEPLLTAPPVTWQLFSGVALPSSSTAGPRLIDGPVNAGYQRSQTGALIAAAQIGTRYLLTPGQGWREVTRRQLLPNAGRDVFVTARAGMDELTMPPGTYGQLAGFRVLAYTPDVAVFTLVSRFATTGMLQATVTTVKWVGGDWRLVLQPDGGTSPTAQRLTSLDGYVVWGGA
jgi:hypothetical protein